MNKVDVGKLLTIAAGFDNRKVDQITVESWASVPGIQSASFEDARAAVIAHQTGLAAKEYLTVNHVVSACAVSSRQTAELVAADVRSARARKMIDTDWPETKPVPADVSALLEQVRADAREVVTVPEVEGGEPIDTDDVGRSL